MNLLSTKHLSNITLVLLAATLAIPGSLRADRLESTPPGWRAHGKGALDGGPFKVRPLSGASGGNRKISVSSAQAEAEPVARPGAPSEGLIAPMSATASSDADYRTPELIALAAGLQNDRDRIFTWVRDHIRYVHYHGCKKGAHLTYLERSGNDIDQSALLVALWRAAGIDCQYVYGLIEMPVTAANQIDWYHYLGADESELGQLVFSRGTPAGSFGVYPGSPANTRALTRLWVQVNIGGNWIYYDPSFKLIQPVVPNLNLLTAMGYSRTNLLDSLGAGTAGTNSITALSYSGLSSYLGARVAQFLSTFRSSHLGNSVADTVGGWVPLENLTVATNSFPIAATGYLWGTYTGETYDVLPAALYATLQVQVQSKSLNWGPVNMASLRGQRLGLAFESGLAKLKLDETEVASATATTAPGEGLGVNVSITHAESSAVVPGVTVNDSATLWSKGDGAYALVYGFDVTSEYLKARQEQLDRYREQGVPDSDQRMRLETLNVIGLNWLLQTELSHQLVANLKNQSPAYLHRFGRVAHELASVSQYSMYIDVPMNFSGFVSRVPDFNSESRLVAEMADSFIASAMEHGVIEQTQPATGSTVVSTTKVLKLANDTAVPVYLATSPATWTAVQGQLTGYSGPASNPATELGQMNQAITDGGQVLVPQNAMIPSGVWRGGAFAYSVLNTTGLRQGMIIGGGYSGGFAGSFIFTPISLPLVSLGGASSYRYNTTQVTHQYTLGGDPIDMASGDFTHTRELLTAGEGPVRGLNLSVNFHGARRFKNEAKMGHGWTHSYNVRATERTDIEGAFGQKTPIEMATSLTGAVAALDLFANRSNVKDWLATALVANWMVDQLKGSGVAIVAGDRIWEFHKQGDGSYTAPAGSTVTLTKDTAYHLTERHGPTWHFDASHRLSTIQDLWGKTLTLTYNAGGDVLTVQDAYARTLTFAYLGSGNSLSGVTDSSTPARSVSLTVNASGDLTSFSDAEGKTDNFSYNPGHLPFRYTNHDGQVVAENYYDASGRVITQYTMGDAAKTWQFYYAPGLTIEREPAGAQTAEITHYFDDHKRETQVTNALGHHVFTDYDGQNRVLQRQRLVSDGAGGWAVNDHEYFGYDANHNLLWSVDAQGYSTFRTYDGSNHLTSMTDPRGHTQYLQNYNAQHQPTQTTDRENRVIGYTYKASGDPGAGSLATMVEGTFTTSFGYDAKGALNLVSYPGGASESRVNNFLGDPTTITDPLGRQTTIAYNQRREVTSTTAPGTVTSGTRTTLTGYDNRRNVESVQNPRGYTTSNTYSATRKLLTTTLPGGAVITHHYDSRDHVDWTRNPLDQTVNFGLDPLGRVTAATDPLGRTRTTIYQDSQRRTIAQSPAPLNIQEKVTVDARGQAVREENGLGHYTVPGYDENGNRTSWVDRRGKTWLLTYDKENRTTATQSPLARTTGQGWNARGLLETITEPSGQVTTLGYDGRRRLTSRSDTVGTIGYTLNAGNEVTAVTQGAATLARTYHASGQVATYTNANGETLSYDYDKNGNLVSLTYPAIGGLAAATITYSYDSRDRLTSMTDWNNRTTTYTWDEAGKLTTMTRPNGTKRALRWDAAGQLLAIEERPASGAPLGLRSFGYDEAGRIKQRLAYPQSPAWTEPAWTAAYDNDNRQTTLAGVALTYDLDGNLQASRLPDALGGGATGTYTWNARNQLTRVVRGDTGQQLDYTYDAEGNLITRVNSQTGTTRFAIDPHGGTMPRVWARVEPSGLATLYVYGAGGALVYEVRQDGRIRYYHYDQVGSTIALTDPSGTVTGRADYTPYGALQGASGELVNAAVTPFLFVGAHGVYTDGSTGMHQMRARWYSCHLRRFLSEDPLGLAAGPNMYAYANGDPINLIDPLGLGAQDAQFTSSWNTLEVAINRNGMLAILNHSDQVVESARSNGVSPNLVAATIMFEHRGWGFIPGSQYAEAALSGGLAVGKQLIGKNAAPTYGFAQLGPDARAHSNLSVSQSLTAVGSIQGAAAWLAVKKQELIDAGINNPSDAQIATRYNAGAGVPLGSVSSYGQNVGAIMNKFEWNFPKSNK